MEDDVVDAADARAAPELFTQLARKRVDGRLAGLDLSAGEFPLERHRLIGAPLRHENATRVVAAERGDHQFSGSGRPRHLAFLAHFRGILP